MESLSEKDLFVKEGYHYREYEVRSTRLLVPIMGPEASPPPSPVSPPDPLERSHPCRLCPLKQPAPASVPPIRCDKYPPRAYVPCRHPVDCHPRAYLSNLSGQSCHTRTTVSSYSPDKPLEYASEAYPGTHPVMSPVPGYVTSHQYKDFVLYPGYGYHGGQHCPPRPAPDRDMGDRQPPRAPYIGRLATPEIGEEPDRFAWEFEHKYVGYEEGEEGGWLLPVREGMFPDL